jgi:hypothetical protein
VKGDGAIESGADKLDQLSGKAAARGGLAGKLAGELTEDAAFMRKLKPSLILRRAKGELPKDQEPGVTIPGRPVVPPGPQQTSQESDRGPNPFVVAGAAFAIGMLLAKLIDWRGHAHPRR